MALTLLGVVSSTVGCAPRTLPDATFTRGAVEVACCGRGDTPVTMTYLGVGGWLIERGASAVLTAPLFSNPSLLETGLSTISADPDRIEAHLPDVSGVTAVLVGHGHYDHLMDVPWILLHAAPEAVAYGNQTVVRQLAPFGLVGGRVRDVTGLAGSAEEAGEWVGVGPGVRIMPLVSDHAPHFAGTVLYSGERERDMREVPSSAEQWLDGRTLAFLIDLLDDDGTVALRIYYQDAVAAAPFGFVPPLDDGVPVDVAIIVPATYAEVYWHPEAILENADPSVVLLAHWEDFFRKPSAEAVPVPFTFLPDFVARLQRALPEGVPWFLPVPGTVFTLRGGPEPGDEG